MIDRAVQKTDTFTGIVGINTQDRAVQEMMGPIVDRSREHLGPADKAIIAARKLLEEAVRTVQDGGDPPGVSPSYYELRAAESVLSADDDWRTDLIPRMDPSLSVRRSSAIRLRTPGRLRPALPRAMSVDAPPVRC